MSRQDWRTPPSVFRALEVKFGPFDCDVAADEHNHLCGNWIGVTGYGVWGRRNWCNPPFGDITPFVRRASLLVNFDATTVMLTHSNCCSPWFREASQNATLYLPDRRISFWHPDEEPGSPDRDTVVWHFGGVPGAVRLISHPDHAKEVRRLWQEASGQMELIP